MPLHDVACAWMSLCSCVQGMADNLYTLLQLEFIPGEELPLWETDLRYESKQHLDKIRIDTYFDKL